MLTFRDRPDGPRPGKPAPNHRLPADTWPGRVRMRARLLAFLGAAVWVVGGCQEEEEAGPAGYVEAPELVLTEEPLPTELAEEPLFQVTDLAAVESEDGETVVAIADDGNHRLVLWRPDEGRAEAVGREGTGPGEFGRISGVHPVPSQHAFMISDRQIDRLAFIHPERGPVGTSPNDLANLAEGGAFLSDGTYLVAVDETASDPFDVRSVEGGPERLELVEADRPAWLPNAAEIERPVHPAYEDAGLVFGPAAPVSFDVVTPLGDWLVWVEQRSGRAILIRRDANPAANADPAAQAGPVVVPIPEEVIGAHVRSFVAERTEEEMRMQRFLAFLSTRPDPGQRRAVLPVQRSTGDPLGWRLEVLEDGSLEARVARLAPGEELPHPVRAVLPLPEDRYLAAHEGGVTLLAEDPGPSS